MLDILGKGIDLYSESSGDADGTDFHKDVRGLLGV